MRAGWYERAGAARDVIVVGDMPRPEPAPGEVLVRLHASGINPSDYKRRANTKAKMEFPRIVPHSDGAGVVAGLGTGVSGFAKGQRVWVFNAQDRRPLGTAAEYISLPAFQVRPLPGNASFEDGACFGIPAMTGHRAVFSQGPVTGKTVYVPGAASRVGAYAVQFAKWGGARVIAAVSSAEKADAVARLGADVVLRRDQGDLADAILAATGGRGVDRICEIDLGANIKVSEKVLVDGGSIASYASANEPTVTLTVSPRRARNMVVELVFVYTMNDAAKDAAARDTIAAQEAGALAHRLAATFTLDRLADAHAAAETQAGTGHVVVSIP
jgi:NADPH2:quinone reductase